jgi:hypothetical protein
MERPHTFEDSESLNLLKSCLKSEVTKRGGTLQTYLSQMSAGYDAGA